MAVLHPLKVIIVNFPEKESQHLQVPNIKSQPSAGFHTVTFDREIWIEQTDFKDVRKFIFITLFFLRNNSRCCIICKSTLMIFYLP